MDNLFEEIFVRIVMVMKLKDGLHFSMTKKKYYLLLQHLAPFWDGIFSSQYRWLLRDPKITSREHIYILGELKYWRAIVPTSTVNVDLIEKCLSELGIDLWNLATPHLKEAEEKLIQENKKLEEITKQPAGSMFLMSYRQVQNYLDPPNMYSLLKKLVKGKERRYFDSADWVPPSFEDKRKEWEGLRMRLLEHEKWIKIKGVMENELLVNVIKLELNQIEQMMYLQPKYIEAHFSFERSSNFIDFFSIQPSLVHKNIFAILKSNKEDLLKNLS
eukprot:TRINITY_DN19990_c0_g1_i1.p1 TRINITY_DN19990_c0_g1~~TRINITY_DN19990_c0_g1_i1.p1  ORF type:complete len:285 (-),score=86.81 TRINITY_DN19990_c0_g1_i1:88-906(-)